MAVCTKCGQQLKEGQLFCTKCGSKVIQVNTTSNNVNPNMNQRVNQTPPQYQQQSNNNTYQQQPTYTQPGNSSLDSLKNVASGFESVQSSFANMNKMEWIIFIASIAAIIAALLPIISISMTESKITMGMSLTLGELSSMIKSIQTVGGSSSSELNYHFSAIVLMILGLCGIVFTIINNKLLQLVSGLVTALFGFYQVYQVNSFVSKMITENSLFGDATLGKGLGWYLLIVASIALIYGVFKEYTRIYNPNLTSNNNNR